MPKIRVNDTTLHYERSGQGPTLLFVHGMAGDADTWADQAQRLGDRFDCVRYDRRGHTRSEPGTAEITYAQHADDCAVLIEALELAPVLLVGSSGGAVVATEVAYRYPHLLRGAVFSEPPLFGVYPDAGAALRAELGPRIEEAFATGDDRAWVDAFFAFLCPGLWTTIDESRKDAFRANAAVGFTELQSPSFSIEPRRLATIDVPALVISGTTSHPTLRDVARRLAAALPDADFVEFEDCGHVTYAEQPAAFAEAVAAFSAGIEQRRKLAARSR